MKSYLQIKTGSFCSEYKIRSAIGKSSTKAFFASFLAVNAKWFIQVPATRQAHWNSLLRVPASRACSVLLCQDWIKSKELRWKFSQSSSETSIAPTDLQLIYQVDNWKWFLLSVYKGSSKKFFQRLLHLMNLSLFVEIRQSFGGASWKHKQKIIAKLSKRWCSASQFLG